MEPTKQELQKMQRDAEQRMREMQRKTAKYSGNGDVPPVPNFVRINNNMSERRPSNNQSQKNRPEQHKETYTKKQTLKPSSSKGLVGKGLDLLKMFNFNNFKLDSDITVIVVLILLLSSEETDELLLLALAYIML